MTAILQPFTQTRREEVAPVLASALSFFFILTALMVLRPRPGDAGGIDAIRWLFVGRAVVTLAVNPVLDSSSVVQSIAQDSRMMYGYDSFVPTGADPPAQVPPLVPLLLIID